MSKRWSKLQARLYNIVDPCLNFQIHCAVYEMNGNSLYHGNKLPRYWITVGKDVVFDYPKGFDTNSLYGYNSYPWDGVIENISNSIENYLQTPKGLLMHSFDSDITGITNILRVCDKRIGKRRLREIYNNTDDFNIRYIIDLRLNA